MQLPLNVQDERFDPAECLTTDSREAAIGQLRRHTRQNRKAGHHGDDIARPEFKTDPASAKQSREQAFRLEMMYTILFNLILLIAAMLSDDIQANLYCGFYEL